MSLTSLNTITSIGGDIATSTKNMIGNNTNYFNAENGGEFKVRDPETISYPDGANYEKDNHVWLKVISSTHSKNAKTSSDSRVDNLLGSTNDNIETMIALPFPQNIQLAEQYDWGSEEIGIASSILGNMNLEQVTSAAGTLVKEKLKSSASSITGLNVKGALAVRDRRIKNPRIAAMFKNVQYRQFALSFSFAPKSENEVKNTINIIRNIRANAAPTFTENSNYIGFPNRFVVSLQSGENILINHGECVATSVTTNYTPDSIWATFRSGFPVHVTLDVAFMETKIVTRQDILSGKR